MPTIADQRNKLTVAINISSMIAMFILSLELSGFLILYLWFVSPNILLLLLVKKSKTKGVALLLIILSVVVSGIGLVSLFEGVRIKDAFILFVLAPVTIGQLLLIVVIGFPAVFAYRDETT